MLGTDLTHDDRFEGCNEKLKRVKREHSIEATDRRLGVGFVVAFHVNRLSFERHQFSGQPRCDQRERERRRNGLFERFPPTVCKWQ